VIGCTWKQCSRAGSIRQDRELAERKWDDDVYLARPESSVKRIKKEKKDKKIKSEDCQEKKKDKREQPREEREER
jgi:hypothetical protein